MVGPLGIKDKITLTLVNNKYKLNVILENKEHKFMGKIFEHCYKNRANCCKNCVQKESRKTAEATGELIGEKSAEKLWMYLMWIQEMLKKKKKKKEIQNELRQVIQNRTPHNI